MTIVDRANYSIDGGIINGELARDPPVYGTVWRELKMRRALEGRHRRKRRQFRRTPRSTAPFTASTTASGSFFSATTFFRLFFTNIIIVSSFSFSSRRFF